MRQTETNRQTEIDRNRDEQIDRQTDRHSEREDCVGTGENYFVSNLCTHTD